MSDSAEEANVTTSENMPSNPTGAPPVNAAQGDSAPNDAEQSAQIANSSADSDTGTVPSSGPPSSGPLSLDKIRQLRQSQQAAQPKPQQRGGGRDQHSSKGQDAGRGPGGDRVQRPDTTPQVSGSNAVRQTAVEVTSPSDSTAAKTSIGSSTPRHDARSHKPNRRDASSVIPTPEPLDTRSKIAIPSLRQPLSQDLELELNAALGGSDLDKLLVGDAMLQVGHELTEGQRISATVMKAHGEFVFVSLGAPNEGVIPSLNFETLPEEGATLDVIVRGYLASEGLYEVTALGSAVDVSDWSDLNEGEVIEVLVTGANTGGLECKVGHIQGFIPASQAAEYRIETLADFVGQKLLCVVTEANPRRGNLVLSHRAVLEREKKEKREERLAALEIGAAVEGVVRKILDFGAFVDIGGLDGLLHVSQLSWDRVKHPSEILEEGQKIQVRIDKIDEATGKIGLTYRSLQDHPWEDIDARFPTGSVVNGAVTRIAEFGAFVRIATGVEGLIHISELAHHRVQNVATVVQEGQEVEVKILSVDAEQQRISLSLKAAQAAPETASNALGTNAQDGSEAAEEEPRPEPVLPKHRGPLKGGTGHANSGEQFGLKW
ncbi:MAG: S1 RNA-binding domain-containing protein [Aureliella sp.]